MASRIPAWCKPTSSAKWHTEPLEDTELQVSLNMHEDWSQTPIRLTTTLDIEHRYAGRTADEWLIINMMPKADPKADIKHWVDAFIKTLGFPIVGLSRHTDYTPVLLDWQIFNVPNSLVTRLGVDEVHLFEGVGRIPDLMRIYILLARRGTVAWKVTLTLASACLPGTNLPTITINDHVRAGATFGTLQFL